MNRPPRRSASAHASSGARDSRHLAFLALREFDESGAFLADSLDSLGGAGMSPADRGFAMELSYTALRRRLTVDAVLRRLVDRDPESVERDLWSVLRLGVVQQLLIPDLPVHAAVHETVELAKSINPRWGGMVNGVLRSLQRLRTSEVLSGPGANAIPLASVLPAAAGDDLAAITVQYFRFGADVFPDPERDPLGYVAAAFSMPRALIERWPDVWNFEWVLQTAAWFTTPGVMSLRVNPRVADRLSLIESLRAAGVDCWEGTLPEAIRVASSTRIDRLAGFEAGKMTIQDESAMRIVDLLAPRPGERILDLCAAPGGKATHAAERMNDEGEVVACDLSARRLRLVQNAAQRLQLGCVSCQAITEDPQTIPAGPYDAAVIDAPCSNTGVLGKRPEARWRLGDSDFQELPGLQQRLLRAAAAVVKPEGRLVYSTCSIDPTENEGVVRGFLAAHSEWTMVTQHQSLIGRPADGGFAALLARK